MNSFPGVALTGAGGFLGFHVRAALRARGQNFSQVALGRGFESTSALAAIDGAPRLIHLAGVNRGTDAEVRELNVQMADQLAAVLSRCSAPPPEVVFANSIQAGNGTTYGSAKLEAGDRLRSAAEKVGSKYVELHLPNLFGEHGKPFYNSVTATFCHLLANRERPEVKEDKPLTLLHAQEAASLLIGACGPETMHQKQVVRSVGELLAQLIGISDTYRNGTIPPLLSDFDRDLFNTYRSYLRPADRVFKLNRNADARGAFFEVIRAEGSSGQSSFSTTASNITRGQHFHLRKIERFSVLSGAGRISMRRLFSTDVVNFDVDGDAPVAIDMPTMWTHNITNIGTELLYTMFWSNEIFDPQAPDTIPEDV
jgi:UDP-2-acetamido-2,6-beta-L-arabino-hexul-4-ose reductase